jgi:hypothetical protein
MLQDIIKNGEVQYPEGTTLAINSREVGLGNRVEGLIPLDQGTYYDWAHPLLFWNHIRVEANLKNSTEPGSYHYIQTTWETNNLEPRSGWPPFPTATRITVEHRYYIISPLQIRYNEVASDLNGVTYIRYGEVTSGDETSKDWTLATGGGTEYRLDADYKNQYNMTVSYNAMRGVEYGGVLDLVAWSKFQAGHGESLPNVITPLPPGYHNYGYPYTQPIIATTASGSLQPYTNVRPMADNNSLLKIEKINTDSSDNPSQLDGNILMHRLVMKGN